MSLPEAQSTSEWKLAWATSPSTETARSRAPPWTTAGRSTPAHGDRREGVTDGVQRPEGGIAMVRAASRVTAPPKGEKTRRSPRKAPWRRPSPSLSALLELGMIDEVEARIASTTDPLDALTWANMRSLLLGHRAPGRPESRNSGSWPGPDRPGSRGSGTGSSASGPRSSGGATTSASTSSNTAGSGPTASTSCIGGPTSRCCWPPRARTRRPSARSTRRRGSSAVCPKTSYGSTS